MVATNDQRTWERVRMFHDAGGLGVSNVEDLVWGVNFRMPEVLGAIALAQLQKLDGLLAAMRARKQMVKAGIDDVMQRKGLEFRKITDPDGDAAICTIMLMHTPEQAKAVAQALRAENIGAGLLYERDRRDLHVYAHWTSVLNKTSWGGNASQWTLAQREIEYHHDMCPRSLELLGRAVHINVSPLLTNEDVEETVEGLNRVLNALT
jgi:dTDP-4-amino-4,6-dideoxygalactose transaminase